MTMGKVYITGDKHGDYGEVAMWCAARGTTKDDLLIVLGDNGVNYYGEHKDKRLKEYLEEIPITFFMIKGNHDQRPSRKLYHIAPEDAHPLLCGTCLVEDDYPSLLFSAMYGGYQFRLENGIWRKAFVLGGAYSVDKWYRLDMQASGYKNYRWFADEQMTSYEMREADEMMDSFGPDIILSHTCPERYIPSDLLLRGIDQNMVDRTMERWMDRVEQSISYEKWYCGHWHTDRSVYGMRCMLHDISELE